jgi:hypothetical protein
MSDGIVNDLEHRLRRHQVQLCSEAANRFLAILKSSSSQAFDAGWATAGAAFTHELIIVAAALYPSETTLRNQFEWASTGRLRQYGIGLEHHKAMLQAYFGAARRILGATAGLDELEAFISRVLTDPQE